MFDVLNKNVRSGRNKINRTGIIAKTVSISIKLWTEGFFNGWTKRGLEFIVYGNVIKCADRCAYAGP